jgi:hypothetical protein
VSHSLFDGPASYDFLSAWASNSAIMKAKGSGLEQQKPVHERGKLLVGNSHQTRVRILDPVFNVVSFSIDTKRLVSFFFWHYPALKIRSLNTFFFFFG